MADYNTPTSYFIPSSVCYIIYLSQRERMDVREGRDGGRGWGAREEGEYKENIYVCEPGIVACVCARACVCVRTYAHTSNITLLSALMKEPRPPKSGVNAFLKQKGT